MLLLDDEDELPSTPSEEEANLATQLGIDGLQVLDARLLACVTNNWLKAARIVADALNAGDFSISEEAVDLHTRHLITLVSNGLLVAQGNLRKPRFSEVRLPTRKAE